MTTTTLTLAEFLLARIGEDEESARVEYGRRDVILAGAFSPARILAECVAKRQVVRYVQALQMDEGRQNTDRFRAVWWVAQQMAKPYADHPNYREDWRP